MFKASMLAISWALLALPIAAYAKDDACQKQPDCKEFGLCSASGQTCVASSLADCASTRLCQDFGMCKPHEGRCVKSPAVEIANSSKTQCGKAGGEWTDPAAGSKGACALPVSDKGKQCASSKQCEIECVANRCAGYALVPAR